MPEAEHERSVEHTLLNTDDASVWAQEFVRIFQNQVIGAEVDEGMMLGWFAGAIETAKNLDRKRRRKQT